MADTEEIIVAYFRVWAAKQEEEREKNWWAWEEVDRLVRKEPEEGLHVTLELIKRSPSDAALGCVAAGPLEDLLTYHGERLFPQIEKAAREDERVRLSLTGVYLRRSNPVYKRVETLLREYGYRKRGAKVL